MKKFIFCLASIDALTITGCRKIETDGEKEIVIIGGGGPATGQTMHQLYQRR